MSPKLNNNYKSKDDHNIKRSERSKRRGFGANLATVAPGFEARGEGARGGEIGASEGVLERELDRLRVRGGGGVGIGSPATRRGPTRVYVLEIGGSEPFELLVVLWEELIGLESVGRRRRP